MEREEVALRLLLDLGNKVREVVLKSFGYKMQLQLDFIGRYRHSWGTVLFYVVMKTEVIMEVVFILSSVNCKRGEAYVELN